MDITIRAYSHAVTAFDDRTEITWSTDASTVAELLTELAEEFDFNAEDANVMRNGKNIKLLDGLETPVEDGDTFVMALGVIAQ